MSISLACETNIYKQLVCVKHEIKLSSMKSSPGIKEAYMTIGTPLTTPAGKGIINGESTDSGTLLYRVIGVQGAVGDEAWFEPKYLKGDSL